MSKICKFAEEYFKATVLLNNEELSGIIRQAEEHPILNGRLRPLLIDGDKFNETTLRKIWDNFRHWFGEDGKALEFKDGDEESLRKRSAFCTCVYKVYRKGKINCSMTGVCLILLLVRSKIGSNERDLILFFVPVFLSESDNLDDIEDLPCENSNEIEFIQAKETLLAWDN